MGLKLDDFYAQPPERRLSWVEAELDRLRPGWRDHPRSRGFLTNLARIVENMPVQPFGREVVEEREGFRLWHYDVYPLPDGTFADDVYVWRDAKGRIRGEYGIGGRIPPFPG
jgi:hypothetical protein